MDGWRRFDAGNDVLGMCLSSSVFITALLIHTFIYPSIYLSIYLRLAIALSMFPSLPFRVQTFSVRSFTTVTRPSSLMLSWPRKPVLFVSGRAKTGPGWAMLRLKVAMTIMLFGGDGVTSA